MPASGAQAGTLSDTIGCVAFWHALLADEATLAAPFDPAALDPETFAFRAAAVRLNGGNAAEVDARVAGLLLESAKLRMDLQNLDSVEEDLKERARAWHGSFCNDLGERLPETRPFFFPGEPGE